MFWGSCRWREALSWGLETHGVPLPQTTVLYRSWVWPTNIFCNQPGSKHFWLLWAIRCLSQPLRLLLSHERPHSVDDTTGAPSQKPVIGWARLSADSCSPGSGLPPSDAVLLFGPGNSF